MTENKSYEKCWKYCWTEHNRSRQNSSSKVPHHEASGKLISKNIKNTAILDEMAVFLHKKVDKK